MDDLIKSYGVFQTAFANWVAILPLGYAFGAGMVAAINPCGFLALPGFGVYYLGLDAQSARDVAWPRRLGRALRAGLAATLGFILLFTLIGLTIAIAGRALAAVFPLLGVALGIVAVGLGIWLVISGRTFGLTALDRFGLPAGTGFLPAFVFGVAYGTLSLACTLPIFLVVVTTSLAGSLGNALLQFVLYAIGMGVVITLVALSAALAGGAFAGMLAGARAWVPRVAGAFLAGAGLFVMYYWVVFGQLL